MSQICPLTAKNGVSALAWECFVVARFSVFVFVVDFVFSLLYIFVVVFGVASCFCLFIIFNMNVFAYKK